VIELLKMAEETHDSQERWERFLKRRQALEAEMELEVCDGCDHCGTRCIAGFGVTQQEWEAVSAFLATQPAEELSRVATQEKSLPWPGTEALGIEVNVTYCRFRDLEGQQCSIYPVRPTICRLFGQTSWLPCPIEAVSKYPETAASVWNDYREQKRKTWEEWQEEEILKRMSNP
jgi:Fe-S-cluster containining protein